MTIAASGTVASGGTAAGRRVLLLTYHFPPERCVACTRTFNLARHLALGGWAVTVMTPDPALWRMPGKDGEKVADELARCGIARIGTPQRFAWLYSGYSCRTYHPLGPARLFRALVSRLLLPWKIGTVDDWYREVDRAARAIHPGDVDVVLASASPFGTFHAARRISRRLGCPYVLDYRDLWSGNPHGDEGARNRLAAEERELVQEAAAISVVSPSMGSYMAREFDVGNRIEVVFNGYDPDSLRGIRPATFDHFAIVYTGCFYPPKRTPAPLIRLLRKLEDGNPGRPWRFHYYGPDGHQVEALARAQGVGHRVQLHGVVSKEESLAAIAGAGMAAVVVSDYDGGDLADRGIVTGKIFEPLGLGTPVLVVAPPGFDVRQIVASTGNGAAFSGSDADGMASYARSLMDGGRPAVGDPSTFSWPVLIRGMSAMLERVTDGSGSSGGGAADRRAVS